jgi:hypothetical protein
MISNNAVAQANRRRRRFAEMLTYLGGICVHCGITNSEALEFTEERLQFDHIVPRDKSFEISKFWSYSWGRIVGELDKCQLLCRECHKEKSLADRNAMVPPPAAEVETNPVLQMVPLVDPDLCGTADWEAANNVHSDTEMSEVTVSGLLLMLVEQIERDLAIVKEMISDGDF